MAAFSMLLPAATYQAAIKNHKLESTGIPHLADN